MHRGHSGERGPHDPPPRPLGRPGLQDKGRLQATRSPDTQVWTQAQRPAEPLLPWAGSLPGRGGAVLAVAQLAHSAPGGTPRWCQEGGPCRVSLTGGTAPRGHGETAGHPGASGQRLLTAARAAQARALPDGNGHPENLGTRSLRLLRCVEWSRRGRRADRGASGSGASRRSPGGAQGQPAAGEGCTQTARGCFYLRPSTGRHPGAGRTGDARGHRGSRRLEPQAPASRLTAHTGQ